MTPGNIDAVTASYHRCLEEGNFVDRFYDIFLAKSPEVAAKFEHTDFSEQKLLLRESLLMVVMFNRSPASVREEMETLGERHSGRRLDIAPHLYAFWLDSLCEAVQHCDAEHTPEMNRLWREAMQPGIDLLITMY